MQGSLLSVFLLCFSLICFGFFFLTLELLLTVLLLLFQFFLPFLPTSSFLLYHILYYISAEMRAVLYIQIAAAFYSTGMCRNVGVFFSCHPSPHRQLHRFSHFSLPPASPPQREAEEHCKQSPCLITACVPQNMAAFLQQRIPWMCVFW